MTNISKQDAYKARQPVAIGETRVTETLNASNDTETLMFTMVADKVSFQASNTLAGNVSFSLDGVNFKNTTSIGASNAIVTFSAHMVRAVKVERTSGEGKLSLVAR